MNSAIVAGMQCIAPPKISVWPSKQHMVQNAALLQRTARFPEQYIICLIQ